MKWTFIVLSLLLFLMETRAMASISAMPSPQKPEKAFVCWKAMQPLLKREGVAEAWKPKLRFDNTFSYTAPSVKISRWWTVEKNGAHEVLVRESPYDRLITRYNVTNKCAAEVATVALKTTSEGFTDAELARTVGKKGIIYSWSPHMYHSVQGIKTIRKVARAKNLSLTLVLDATATEKDALRILKREGIKDVKLAKMNSLELTKRNTQMHFPNILMHKDGHIVGPMVPGVMGENTYSRVVGKYLE